MEMKNWKYPHPGLILDSPLTGFMTLDKLCKLPKVLGSAFKIEG